jgi:hypothetical protein
MGTGMTLWEEILYIWILLTIMPKLVIIPIFRWLLRAIQDTKHQDEIDAIWLASLESGGSDDDRGTRRRRSRPRGPRGPRAGGGRAVQPERVAERRAPVRARPLPRTAYAR